MQNVEVIWTLIIKTYLNNWASDAKWLIMIWSIIIILLHPVSKLLKNKEAIEVLAPSGDHRWTDQFVETQIMYLN